MVRGAFEYVRYILSELLDELKDDVFHDVCKSFFSDFRKGVQFIQVILRLVVIFGQFVGESEFLRSLVPVDGELKVVLLGLGMMGPQRLLGVMGFAEHLVETQDVGSIVLFWRYGFRTAAEVEVGQFAFEVVVVEDRLSRLLDLFGLLISVSIRVVILPWVIGLLGLVLVFICVLDIMGDLMKITDPAVIIDFHLFLFTRYIFLLFLILLTFTAFLSSLQQLLQVNIIVIRLNNMVIVKG